MKSPTIRGITDSNVMEGRLLMLAVYGNCNTGRGPGGFRVSDLYAQAGNGWPEMLPSHLYGIYML